MGSNKKKVVKKKAAKKNTVGNKTIKKTAVKKAPIKKKGIKKSVPKKPASKKVTKKISIKKADKTDTGKSKIKVTLEQRHKMICEAAYYISLEKTYETVNPTEDWLQAESFIDQICSIH